MNRLLYIDSFRGFGIILMIMGHVGYGELFDKFIHAFHMPMFFFVSGYFYSYKNIRIVNFLQKKTYSLIVPYLITGGFCFLISLPIFNDMSKLTHLLFVNTTGLPIAGALWFLTALYFCDLLYFIMDRFLTVKKLTIAVFFLAILGCYLPSFLPFRMPWALDVSLVGCGMYHSARLIRDNEMKLRNIFDLKNIYILLLGCGMFTLIFINGNVNLREGVYSNIALFWINAIGSCIVGINICRKIESINNKCFSKIMRCVYSIGEHSITYLCWNQLIIIVVYKIFRYLNWGDTLWVHGVVLILVICILYKMDSIIMDSKIKFIIGK